MNEPESSGPKPAASKPAFSIVMPLWNKETTVVRAIRSVLAQTVQEWELIVVDDGSTDGSAAEVERFTDPRIRMVHQPNAGVSAARNRGIQEAKADWVALLDADDEWLPRHLEDTLEVIRVFSEARTIGTNYLYAGACGKRWPTHLKGLNLVNGPIPIQHYFDVASVSDPPLCASTISVDRRSIKCIGGFPIGVTAGEDLLTWARLAARYPVAFHPSPSALFYTPLGFADRPTRRPQEPDAVGAGLDELATIVAPVQQQGLLRYRAHWHTMRGVVYLDLGSADKALPELKKARSLAGATLKLRLLMVMAHLPSFIPAHVIALWRRWKRQTGNRPSPNWMPSE